MTIVRCLDLFDPTKAEFKTRVIRVVSTKWSVSDSGLIQVTPNGAVHIYAPLFSIYLKMVTTKRAI